MGSYHDIDIFPLKKLFGLCGFSPAVLSASFESMITKGYYGILVAWKSCSFSRVLAELPSDKTFYRWLARAFFKEVLDKESFEECRTFVSLQDFKLNSTWIRLSILSTHHYGWITLNLGYERSMSVTLQACTNFPCLPYQRRAQIMTPNENR